MTIYNTLAECIDAHMHPLHTSTFPLPPPRRKSCMKPWPLFILSTSMYLLYHNHSTHLLFISPHLFLSLSLTHTTHTHLRVLARHPAHVLRVQLDRVISQLGLCSSLEVLTANWEVAISLHPPAKCASHDCHMILPQDIT